MNEDVLREEDREAAIEALNDNEWGNDAISTALAALYGVFVDDRQGLVDPGGAFTATKGSALDALDPLLELIASLQRRSEDRKGWNGRCFARITNLSIPISSFMDFYLSPPERTTQGPLRRLSGMQRQNSLDQPSKVDIGIAF